jgi:hypothetical protein
MVSKKENKTEEKSQEIMGGIRPDDIKPDGLRLDSTRLGDVRRICSALSASCTPKPEGLSDKVSKSSGASHSAA